MNYDYVLRILTIYHKLEKGSFGYCFLLRFLRSCPGELRIVQNR